MVHSILALTAVNTSFITILSASISFTEAVTSPFSIGTTALVLYQILSVPLLKPVIQRSGEKKITLLIWGSASNVGTTPNPSRKVSPE
jgi:NADPH:quinone reductase-like Zn-dependent oxidoreductase